MTRAIDKPQRCRTKQVVTTRYAKRYGPCYAGNVTRWVRTVFKK
jgi:hypothetical protein